VGATPESSQAARRSRTRSTVFADQGRPVGVAIWRPFKASAALCADRPPSSAKLAGALRRGRRRQPGLFHAAITFHRSSRVSTRLTCTADHSPRDAPATPYGAKKCPPFRCRLGGGLRGGAVGRFSNPKLWPSFHHLWRAGRFGAGFCVREDQFSIPNRPPRPLCSGGAHLRRARPPGGDIAAAKVRLQVAGPSTRVGYGRAAGACP
jgi:hypothetical protein